MAHPDDTTILLVARGADPVGAGREVEISASGLAASGWRVHVAFTSTGGSLAERLAAGGVAVHRLGRRPQPDPAVIGRLANVMHWVKPSEVISFGRPQASLAAAAAMLRVPAARRPRVICRVAAAPRTLVDAWALTRADRVAASSPFVAEACRKVGVSIGRLDVIEPVAGAASSSGMTREQVAMRLRLDPEKTWSLCVAPLIATSRLDRLLWGIDQLGVVRRDVEHVLVGGGPQLHRLWRRARVQHLADRLRIVPFCDALPDLLREVRFVWQSGEVAFGGALFDAMSVGKPTVAVTSDAARQAIVDGQTGWIVPSLPESEFPRRAFSLVEDEAAVVRFGAAARERAATLFSPDRFVARLLAAVA